MLPPREEPPPPPYELPEDELREVLPVIVVLREADDDVPNELELVVVRLRDDVVVPR